MKTLLWLVLLAASNTLAAPLVLHVATNGNDQATGRRPEAGPTLDGPLATVEAAILRARAQHNPDGVTVFLHHGTHRLAQPLVLTPVDSGADARHPFTITAGAGAQPVLSGGVRLTRWTQDSPGLWTTDARTALGDGPRLRSLFIDGRRAIRARTPNEGQLLHMDGARLNDQPFRFKYRENDIQPGWAALGDVEIVAYEKWTDIRQYIRDVAPAERLVTLSGSSTPHTRESNAAYFIENAPDALDQPGEWRLDQATGRVHLRLAPGQDPNRLDIVAPRLQELIRFQGNFQSRDPVHHVVLRGLTFADTDWDMGPDGYRDTQAAVAVRGDVLADGLTDSVIEDCTFTRLAGYGIDLGRGCQRNRIARNVMRDLGAGGVRIGETSVRADAFEATHSTEIVDNHLHHLGRLYPPAVGVFILQSATNRVAHNHIHDLYYTAVSVGWTWGYHASPCHHNVIEFNHLHDIGLGLLSDMGAVYTLGPQPGTIVRNNRIHDVSSSGYGGWGLYTDEGSTGIVLENNLVYRCKSAGFHQHYGKENIVRNNVFAFNREHQLMRTRDEDHTSFFFTNNIVVFDSGSLLGSSWKNNRFVMDRNVYWDARAAGAVSADPPAFTLKFSGLTLDQWRARGHDRNSVVADPLFVDPARDDYSLKPGSPAFRLGFQPIDTRAIGPRPR